MTSPNNAPRQIGVSKNTPEVQTSNRSRISSNLYPPPPQAPPLPPSFLAKKPHSSKFNTTGDHQLPPKIQHTSRNLDPLTVIKRRFDALKQLQLKTAIQETKLYEELHLLECKYNKLAKPFYEIRRKIVNGEREPTEEECSLPNKMGDSLNIGERGDNKNKNSEESVKQIHQDLLAFSVLNYKAAKRNDNRSIGSDSSNTEITKGIPEFWLTVFKRVGLISKMIEPYDEPILKSLVDIELDLSDRKPFNFAIKFHFAPNEYFTNSVLSKTYEFKIEIDPNESCTFEGPEPESSRGSEIKWKRGKNVTVRGGEAQPSETDEDGKQSSFFNFFDTVSMPSGEASSADALTSEQEAELVIDFEIGYAFKEKAVPRAILYYTDEICDESDDEAEDFDDNDDVFEDGS